MGSRLVDPYLEDPFLEDPCLEEEDHPYLEVGKEAHLEDPSSEGMEDDLSLRIASMSFLVSVRVVEVDSPNGGGPPGPPKPGGPPNGGPAGARC